MKHSPSLYRATIPERQKLIAGSSQEKYADLYSARLDLELVSTRSCENVIGAVEIPVGVAGPLLIDQKSMYIPLATTEAALVASINRGCKALRNSGGVSCITQYNGITRSPVFACHSGAEALAISTWVDNSISTLAAVAEKTSAHLKFLSHTSWIRGRQVFFRFCFDTDQAMGMNMATIATEAICQHLLKLHPHISLISLSSNVCTDKKDSSINTLLGRGHWAQAECFLPESVISTDLKTTSQQLFNTHVAKNLIGSNVAGSLSQNGQVANVLAAMFIATGQDPAHIVEGSKAFLTIEQEHDGVYVALTLPNLQVGTVGGGTYLPAQAQARSMMAGGETLSIEQLVRCIAGTALAGELSLLAALSNNTLSSAHQKLARNG